MWFVDRQRGHEGLRNFEHVTLLCHLAHLAKSSCCQAFHPLLLPARALCLVPSALLNLDHLPHVDVSDSRHDEEVFLHR